MKTTLVAILISLLLLIHGYVTTEGTTTVINFAFRKWLLLLCCVPLAFLVKWPEERPFYWLVACVLGSVVLSPHPWIAFAGHPELRTGASTWLVCLLIYIISREHLEPRHFLYILAPYVIIDSVVGIASKSTDVLAILLPVIAPGVTMTNSAEYVTILGNRNYSSGMGAVRWTLYYIHWCETKSKLSLALWILSVAIVICANCASGYVTIWAIALLTFCPLWMIIVGILFAGIAILVLDPTFSGRMPAWIETTKLFFQRPLGYGLDTIFAYLRHVPGNFVKPHNAYLGISLGLGVPGLAAFIVLVFNEIFAKSYVTAAMAAMLIQWLVNDATVETLPLFFAMLGAKELEEEAY